MCLLALAAWAPIPRSRQQAMDAPHTILLTMVAATIALALLVTAAFQDITPLAVGFAAGALVLASVRAALTYLENVRILRRSAREALTDALSGLGNRRCLMEDLDEAFGTSGTGHPLTVLFFDLNGFKRYNDSFGHAAGDALLARIGARLRASIGEHGRAYRLGGDEFCVLLDGRYGRDDMPVVAAAAALVEHGSGFMVSSSMGLAVMPDEATSATAALQLADERMYCDKEARSSLSRAQAHGVLTQLLNERALGLRNRVGGVGALAAAVGARLTLGAEQLDELQRAAELHDIGMLALPDEILNKPGPLTESEWRFVRQHPAIGERILGAAPALRPVARLVRSSHERWDGKGYPDGISGLRIPLGARIIATCDAYDAMVSQRSHRPARSTRDAIVELRRCAGTQFDPDVVAAVCAVLEEAQADRPVAGNPSGAAAVAGDPPLPAAASGHPRVSAIDQHAVAADVELRS
jgi:diguanylate cyclase (GGDEF)-like protein